MGEIFLNPFGSETFGPPLLLSRKGLLGADLRGSRPLGQRARNPRLVQFHHLLFHFGQIPSVPRQLTPFRVRRVA